MNFPQAIASGFKNLRFSGRATRSEFWYWYLFYFLGFIAIVILDEVIFPRRRIAGDMGPIEAVYDLILLFPTWAIQVRRLHDVNRSGWWLLISLTIVGLIYPLLFWWCKKGTDGPNHYGEDTYQLDRIAAQFE